MNRDANITLPADAPNAGPRSPGDEEPHPPSAWGAAAAERLEATATRARGLADAVHGSAAWAWARRYLPVYRWVSDLQDTTIAVFVAGGWGMWLLGGVFAFAVGGAGAPLVGAVLALVGIGVDVAVVRWWMGYRRAPARLRHQILARGQIAAGRELADSSLAAAQVARLGEQVRPTLAAHVRAGTTGRPERRSLTATGAGGRTRPLRPGTLPGCPVRGEAGGER
jgi:hypothetical protein